MTSSKLPPPPAIKIALGSGLRHALLRMPTVGQSHVFVADPSLGRRAAAHVLADRLQVLDVIDTLDGEAPTMDDARKIAADPAACTRVLLSRAGWLAAWRDAGVTHARCPYCHQESCWTLPELAALQGAKRRPLADAHGRLPPFALSWPQQPAVRPAGVALAAAIRFELPSRVSAAGANGSEGILKSIDPVVETIAWQQFAPIGEDPPEERDDWTFESAGFRAVLRACVALASLDGKPRGDITPADLEPWPLGDFCFLDELYALVYATPALAALPSRCGGCGQTFLPLA